MTDEEKARLLMQVEVQTAVLSGELAHKLLEIRNTNPKYITISLTENYIKAVATKEGIDWAKEIIGGSYERKHT